MINLSSSGCDPSPTFDQQVWGPSRYDRLAIDVFGSNLAAFKCVALDPALLPVLAGHAHGLAYAEGHERYVREMMIGHVMEVKWLVA